MNTTDNTPIRNKKIIEEYETVVRSFGSLAAYMPTIYFCTIVGDTLGYSPAYVRKIINKHIRSAKA